MIISEAQISVSSNIIGFKEDENSQIAVKVSMTYSHPGGGSNGSDIVTLWLDRESKLIGYRKPGQDYVEGAAAAAAAGDRADKPVATITE